MSLTTTTEESIAPVATPPAFRPGQAVLVQDLPARIVRPLPNGLYEVALPGSVRTVRLAGVHLTAERGSG